MIETLWHYLGPFAGGIVALAVGGLALRRENFKRLEAQSKILTDTADGWEKAYKQRGEELTLLTERFGRLQLRFDEQERRYNEITTLNLSLQIELKARDVTIAELKGEIGLLTTQVDILQKKLGSFMSRD